MLSWIDFWWPIKLVLSCWQGMSYYLIFSKQTLLLCYQGTFVEVLSHLLYSLLVWGPPLSQYNSLRMQQMQNCAVWLCRGLRMYWWPCKLIYPELNWLPFGLLVQHCRLSALHNMLSSSVRNWNHLLYLGSIICMEKDHLERLFGQFAVIFHIHRDYFWYKTIQWWKSLNSQGYVVVTRLSLHSNFILVDCTF